MPTSDATVRSSGIARQMERFLDHLAVERGVAPNTGTAYRRDLGLYLKYLTGRGIGGGPMLPWLDGVEVKWFAWAAEYPETSIYGKDSPKSEGR